MAWNSRRGYRDRYLGGKRNIRNKVKAWTLAKLGLVPTNIWEEDQREGSSFVAGNLILDYDFDDTDFDVVNNKAPNGPDITLGVYGGEWVYDDEHCVSAFTTSAVYGNLRGRTDEIAATAALNKEFSFDFWIRCHDLTTTGPPRFFSMAPLTVGNTGHGPSTPDSYYRCNFAALQGPTSSPYSGDDVQLRLRLFDGGSDAELGGTSPSPTVASNVLTQDALHHIAFTVKAVDEANDPNGNDVKVYIGVYVDGVLVENNIIDCPPEMPLSDVFSNWETSQSALYLLTLLDEGSPVGTSGGRGLKGSIYRFRFWDAAIANTDVLYLHNVGPKGQVTCNWAGNAIGDLGSFQVGGAFTEPIGNDDYETVYFGNFKTLNVTANDQVFGGKVLRYSSVTLIDPPASGIAVVRNDGNISYSCIDFPDDTPAGTDSFTYKVKDSANLWTSATCYISVASGPGPGAGGGSITPTIPFTGGTAYPGRYAPYGTPPSQVTSMSGGAATGPMAQKYGVTWPIPWKSTTGPNNDHYKLIYQGSQTAPDIPLSGIELLYPELASTNGAITITQPGVYENFISYKYIHVRAHDVTLRNFVVDPCWYQGSQAAALIDQKHNSTEPYDPNFILINEGSTDNDDPALANIGPCPFYRDFLGQWQLKGGATQYSNYAVYSTTTQPGGQSVSGLHVEDATIRGGMSKSIYCSFSGLVLRCDIAEGGGDSVEFRTGASAIANHCHHNGFLQTSHADGMQHTGAFDVYMLGNFIDMPAGSDDFPISMAPYKSNAALVVGCTKSNFGNQVIVGNWVNAGNHTWLMGDGSKWNSGGAYVKEGVSASANGNCVFSLNGPQFASTPEGLRQLIAGPDMRLEKYVHKNSCETQWRTVPQDLWGFLDNSTIVLSGPATGWPAIYSDCNDPYAYGPNCWTSDHFAGNDGCNCINQCWFDLYNASNPNTCTGANNTSNNACDIVFKPTLDGEPVVYSETKTDGTLAGGYGKYRLTNPTKCQLIGYYDDPNTATSFYHPKTASGVIVADNRHGVNFNFGLINIGITDKCYGDFENDLPYAHPGTLSGWTFSGNVWDQTGQVIGSSTGGGYSPDWNQVFAGQNGTLLDINEICLPLSGIPYGESGSRRRSDGWCQDPLDLSPITSYPQNCVHCPDPWCP